MENDLIFISRKLQQGDEDTYIFLFRKYYVPLCSYARRYVGRKDVAEELVSETFFNIWKNRATLEIHSSVKGYLFHAVCNNSLNYLRKLRKEDCLEDYFKGNYSENLGISVISEDLPSDSLIMKDLASTIDQAVNSLPPQQQIVFRLKRYEGKKNTEIAEIMGLSVKTVEMHLSKALLSMRHNLKEYMPEFLLFLMLKDIL